MLKILLSFATLHLNSCFVSFHWFLLLEILKTLNNLYRFFMTGNRIKPQPSITICFRRCALLLASRLWWYSYCLFTFAKVLFFYCNRCQVFRKHFHFTFLFTHSLTRALSVSLCRLLTLMVTQLFTKTL